MKLFLYMDEGAISHEVFTEAAAGILSSEDGRLFGVTIEEHDPLYADAVSLWTRYEQRVDEQLLDDLYKRGNDAEA